MAVSADVHRVRRSSTLERLFEPFWVVPAMVCAVALVAGLVLPRVDESVGHTLPHVFHGGPDGARSLLGTIASAMISVTGLVFSITMVVLQLASSQFTPRVLKHFLSNRTTQWTLGVFVASFVYSLTVLRKVRGGFDGQLPFVPQLSVSLAYVLVLSSVGLFLAFIQQVTSLIQVSTVISRLGDATTRAVEEALPAPDEEPGLGQWQVDGPGRDVLVGDDHGHVVEVDEGALVDLAREHDLRIRMLVCPGLFLAPGDRLATVWGLAGDETLEEVRSAVVLASDRALGRDPAFGLRQLVDIGDRALSPGTNDPTTAVQVLHELRRVLGAAVQRVDPPRHLADDDGTVRLEVQRTSVEDLLLLGTEEIAHYGRDGVQVPRALDRLLDDLDRLALPQHHQAVHRARRTASRREQER